MQEKTLSRMRNLFTLLSAKNWLLCRKSVPHGTASSTVRGVAETPRCTKTLHRFEATANLFSVLRGRRTGAHHFLTLRKCKLAFSATRGAHKESFRGLFVNSHDQRGKDASRQFPLWNPLCLQSDQDDVEDLYRSFLRATAHPEVTL